MVRSWVIWLMWGASPSLSRSHGSGRRPGLGIADNCWGEPRRTSARANAILVGTCKEMCGTGEVGVGRSEVNSPGSLHARIAGG